MQRHVWEVESFSGSFSSMEKRTGNGQVTFPAPLRLIYREGERRKKKERKTGFLQSPTLSPFLLLQNTYLLALWPSVMPFQGCRPNERLETGHVASNLRRCCGHRIKQYDQPSHRWLDNHTTFQLQPQSFLAARGQIMGGQMPSSCHTHVRC